MHKLTGDDLHSFSHAIFSARSICMTLGAQVYEYDVAEAARIEYQNETTQAVDELMEFLRKSPANKPLEDHTYLPDWIDSPINQGSGEATRARRAELPQRDRNTSSEAGITLNKPGNKSDDETWDEAWNENPKPETAMDEQQDVEMEDGETKDVDTMDVDMMDVEMTDTPQTSALNNQFTLSLRLR
ncbi:hypothetical protein F4780DRAFT_10206 [Xylariomycetidae sp. FL0641]|nr:hypothetical protein F4780DRAFT_10206 [Xylariomycetidae sp. FL0641]